MWNTIACCEIRRFSIKVRASRIETSCNISILASRWGKIHSKEVPLRGNDALEMRIIWKQRQTCLSILSWHCPAVRSISTILKFDDIQI
jgi:hypothetical protein